MNAISPVRRTAYNDPCLRSGQFGSFVAIYGIVVWGFGVIMSLLLVRGLEDASKA